MEKVKHTGKREQLQAFILQLTRNNLIFGTNIRLYTAPPQEGLVVLYLSE